MLTTQNDDDHRGDHDEPRGEPPYESLKTSRDEVVCLRQSVEVPGRGIRSMDTSAGIVQLSGEHMQQGTGCGMSSEANCVWFGPFASAFSRRLFNILLPSVWTTDSRGRLDSESHVVYLHANRYIRYNFYNRYALHSVMYRNPKPELYTKKLTTIYIMNTFLPQEVSDLQSASLNRNLHSSIACAYESPSLRVMYNKDHHGSEFRLKNRHNIFGRNNHGQLLEESARHASQNNFTYQRTEQLWSRRDNKDTRGISGGSGSQTPESRLCTMITALRCEMLHLKEYDVQLLLQLKNIRASIAEIKQSINDRGVLCYLCGNNVSSVFSRSISSDGSSDETIVFNETTAYNGENNDACIGIKHSENNIEGVHCRVINWLLESYSYFNSDTESTENDLTGNTINKRHSDRSRKVCHNSQHHLPENTRRSKLRIQLDTFFDESCWFSECVRFNRATMRIFERSTTVSYGHDADRARTLGFYHAIYADDAGSRSFPFLSNDSLLNKLDTQVKFRPRPRLHRQVNFTNSFDVTFDGKSAKIILSESESIERSVTDANVQNDITAEDQQKEYIQVIKTELHESADNRKVIAVADAGEECVKDEVLGEDDSATTFRTGDGSEYGPLINESENGTDNCRNDYMTVNEQELQRKGNSGDCHYKGANNGIVLIICDHVEAQANVDTATTERFDEDKSEINDQVLCKTKNKVTNNNYVETYEKNTEEIECDDSDSDSSYMIDVFDKCEGTYVNLQDGFATCRIMSPGLQEKINEQKYQVEDSELVYLQIVDGRIVFKPRDMCLEIDHDDSYFIDALFFDDSR